MREVALAAVAVVVLAEVSGGTVAGAAATATIPTEKSLTGLEW